MKTFKSFRHTIEEANKINDVLELLKYLSNEYYFHFGERGKVVMPKKGQVEYISTPLGWYAWQVNSYRKEIIRQIGMAAKRVKNYGSPESFMLESIFPYGTNRQYVYVVKAKSGLTWLNLRRIDQSQAKRLFNVWSKFMKTYSQGTKMLTYDEFKEVYSSVSRGYSTASEIESLPSSTYKSVIKSTALGAFRYAEDTKHGPTFEKFLYRMVVSTVRELAYGSAPETLTDIIVKSGYDAIRDDGTGTLFQGESAQVAFFNRKAFTHVATFGDGGSFLINESNVDAVLEAIEKLK